MKLISMSLPICFMLIGCATTSQYKTKLDALVGQPKAELMSQWGEPTGRYTDENGHEVIAYIRTRSVIVPGAHPISFGLSAPHQQVVVPERPTSEIPLICMTKFILSSSGVVRSFTFKGNDCKAISYIKPEHL